MLTHREFSAWIVSDDQPLREYLVTVDTNANRISCWIPSEAGKCFSVRWRDQGSQVHSCSFISLDGFVVPGRFLCGHGEASREGVRTGSNTERPFVFADKSNTASGNQNDKDAGTIVLKIRRVFIDGSRAANKLQQLPEPSVAQSHMSSHCIRFGEERHTYQQFPQTWHVKPFDRSGNRSYVTFVFRYGSREFLFSQGIVSMDDALQVPPAVEKACMINRRVANAPLPEGSSPLMTSSATPSPYSTGNSELMDSASVPTRPVTNSTKGPSRHNRYPGEGILILGPTTDPNITWM